MPSVQLKRLLFVLPLFLAGCGDGYVPTAYTGFPYGNIRTAGSGVAYVRASMLPERGPVLEAIKPENKAIVELQQPVVRPREPAPIQETKDILKNMNEDADKLFNNKQRK